MSHAPPADPARTLQTSGIVIHTPRRFDLILAAIFLFREGAFRERLADRARLALGETVLDVGCGTGSFAVVAARRVGALGRVHAIDASSEMIDRAEAKARRAGQQIGFARGLAEALPSMASTFVSGCSPPLA